MSDLKILVLTVNTPDGEKNVASYLPHDFLMEHGLMPEGVLGELRRPLEKGEPITPEVFAPNRAFIDFMHYVIQRHAQKTTGFAEEAKRQGEGWIYVIDQRTPNPAGDVPPQDIVGAFEVRDGTITPDSYQLNQNHQVMTSDGFVDLGAEYREMMLEEIRNSLEA